FTDMGRIGRIVVVGGRGSGKTSILEAAIFANSMIDKPYMPTIEDTYVGIVETERGTREKLRFYDTQGLDARNRSLPTNYHAMADAYILVYSISDNLSFQLLTDIKKDIDKNRDKKDVPIIVLGNKKGTSSPSRAVELATAEKWASMEKLPLWEVNVQERSTLLKPIANLATRLNPPASKTSFPQLTMGRKNKD
ncbi:unnamed protein product, partial [Meganyctiphanes norvegica]